MSEQIVRDTPVLHLEHISKRFPGQQALDDVSLHIEPGEIHALVGQNGSGKSTLIKILAGYHLPDEGASGSIGGEEIEWGEPKMVEHQGVRFLHQDLALVPTLSVLDNLALGRGYHAAAFGWIDWPHEVQRAEASLQRVGLDIDVRRLVSTLSPVEQTMVAMARALDADEDIHLLVLDEPTASLPQRQVERLFEAIRHVAAQGGAVLYVSHRLDEIFEIADRVTVLRDGQKVGTLPVEDLDHDRLVELIVGTHVEELGDYPDNVPRTAEVLEVEKLEGETVRNASFVVHQGEVLGVAGIEGSGRHEIAQLIFGAQERRAGKVFVKGQPYTDASPRRSIERGIGYLPADRHAHAIIPPFDLRENLTLPRLQPATVLGGFVPWMSLREESRDALTWLEQLDVRPADPDHRITTLSGGNQQKVILARWFRCPLEVLLLDEPAQGVDVGAKVGIHQRLADAAGRGMALVICSSEAEDLAMLCDRVLVMRRGTVAAELHGDSLTASRIVHESLTQTRGEAVR